VHDVPGRGELFGVAARALLEQMLKAAPRESQPQDEADFASVVCRCAHLRQRNFTGRYLGSFDLRELPGGAQGPVVCVVCADDDATRALMIEARVGWSCDGASEPEVAAPAPMNVEHVERAVAHVNAHLHWRHDGAPPSPPPPLESRNVAYVRLGLGRDMSVTMTESPRRKSRGRASSELVPSSSAAPPL
jgi:hypothetical protein